MKAVVVDACVRSSVPGLKGDSRCVASKSSPTKADHFDSTEMKACFSKLQQLVPSMTNREGKIDKTELLQHVIDYILDLEDTLAFSSSSPFCGVVDSSISRQPLAEKSDCNIKKASIKMTGGDFVALSTVPSLTTIEEFDFRPPSK